MVYKPQLKQSVARSHKCDEAVFNVLLNDVVIGEVNLNNLVDGGSRNGTVEVTEAQAIEIAKKGGNAVKLSLQCLLPRCHSDVAEIRISNNTGVIYHSCTPTLQSRGANINDLLILDKCGTKIVQRNTREVDASGKEEVKKESGAAYWDALEKLGKIKKLPDGSYKVLGTQAISDPQTGIIYYPETEKYKDEKNKIIPKPSF